MLHYVRRQSFISRANLFNNSTKQQWKGLSLSFLRSWGYTPNSENISTIQKNQFLEFVFILIYTYLKVVSAGYHLLFLIKNIYMHLHVFSGCSRTNLDLVHKAGNAV